MGIYGNLRQHCRNTEVVFVFVANSQKNDGPIVAVTPHPHWKQHVTHDEEMGPVPFVRVTLHHM